MPGSSGQPLCSVSEFWVYFPVQFSQSYPQWRTSTGTSFEYAAFHNCNVSELMLLMSFSPQLRHSTNRKHNFMVMHYKANTHLFVFILTYFVEISFLLVPFVHYRKHWITYGQWNCSKTKHAFILASEWRRELGKIQNILHGIFVCVNAWY